MASIELARALGAAEWIERDGWVLRRTPASDRRRSNSALPVTERPGLGLLAPNGPIDLVQVEPLAQRSDLDDELAARGWTLEAPSLVLTRGAHHAPAEPIGVTRCGDELRVDRGRATIRALSTGDLALFSLEVEPAVRRQGRATTLLAAAARAASPGTVLVQVDAANAGARAFYAAAGFELLHRYHYRRAPATP